MNGFHLYLERPSWLHRLHPVMRLVSMVVLIILAFAVHEPERSLLLVGLLVAGFLTTGTALNLLRLRYLLGAIFLFTFISWSLFYAPAGQLPPRGDWPAWLPRAEALWFALGMALKFVTSAMAGVLFLSTTRIEDFSYALHKLGVPYKAGFALSLTFRLVPLLLDAASTVLKAQQCRGVRFDEDRLSVRLRRQASAIVPVFMGALRRADEMAMALEMRGFQSKPGVRRTCFRIHPVGWGDVATALVLLALSGWTLAT